MLVCLRVTIALRKTKINNVYNVRFLAKAHEEVLRLDISVDEVLSMQTRDSAKLNKKSG